MNKYKLKPNFQAEYLDRKNLTQREFARRTEISVSWLQKILAGAPVGKKVRRNIQLATDLRPPELWEVVRW